MSEFIDPELYSRYCKAWRVYLDNHNECGSGFFNQRRSAFFIALKPALRGINPQRVIKFPGNWPEVELWFGDVKNFTEAVENAQQLNETNYE